MSDIPEHPRMPKVSVCRMKGKESGIRIGGDKAPPTDKLELLASAILATAKKLRSPDGLSCVKL